MTGTGTFTIRQHPAFRPLAGLFGGWRGTVTLDGTSLAVRYGAMFRMRVPRSSVVSATPRRGPVLGLGAHVWRRRWLVNGSSKGLVSVAIEPLGRARVLGFPVRVREVTVSLDDPEGFLAALGVPARDPCHDGRPAVRTG